MILQGNLDPSILYGPDHMIKERTEAILKVVQFLCLFVPLSLSLSLVR
jgi:uroporphyrinogen-III decarboxylase